MEKDKISIIVPVYNVEEYLDRCVESIVNQTYTNLEIILVDDGSPDRCPILCDNWAKKDSRIVVIHKKNGGVSSARNAGIHRASGKFIQFVDSDDFICKEFCEDLVSQYSSDTDLVISGFTIIDDEGKIKKVCPNNKDISDLKTSEDEFLQCLSDGYIDMPVNKLYRKSLIIKNFQEDLPLGEDRVFVLDYLANVKNKIKLVRSCGYIYEFHQSSACHKYREDLYQILMVSINALKKYLIYNYGSSNKQLFYKLVLNNYVNIINKTHKEKLKNITTFLLNDENYYDCVKNYKPQGFKEKIKFFLIKHKMFGLLRFISRAKNR